MEEVFRIAVVYSTYPQLTKAARELVNKRNFELEVRECVFDEAVREALEFEKRGFDLIISRGVTGTLIRSAVSIPVVLVEITNFDILHNLYKASQVGEKIAYFAYASPNNYHDFDTITDILGMGKDELTIYYFNNEKELREKVEMVFQSDVDVVVASGAFVSEMAKKHGMKSIIVHSSTEAIYNAFRQAEEILQGRMNDQKKIKSFISIFNNLKSGIIIANKDDNIIHVNSAAETIFGLKADKLLGNKVSEVKLPEVKTEKEKTMGEIIKINEEDYLFNCIPLMVEERYYGRAFTLENIQQLQKIEEKIRKQKHSDGMVAKYEFDDIIGESTVIQKTIGKAQKYARSDATILIAGESGTGKEIFANSIHNYSYRSRGPFVAINCAALPETLLESELFGYDEGAFTGAKKGGKPGLFELAHKGTIFLDEISEISNAIQARLLRVLQEKEIRRVGGKKNIPTDVRVIAATNADIQQKVKEGTFRDDLFYRLNIFSLNIPPLRERPEDIPLLVDFFIKKHSHQTDTIPEMLMDKIKQYYWPGNVRELESFVEKFIVLKDDTEGLFLLDDLYHELSSSVENPGGSETVSNQDGDNVLNVQVGTLKEMEEQIIKSMYLKHGKDKASIARKLGVSRTTIWSKLKNVDLE